MNSSRDSQTLYQEEILGDELEKIDNFFHQLQEPKNLAEIRRFTEEFCRKNSNRKIVLITVIYCSLYVVFYFDKI